MAPPTPACGIPICGPATTCGGPRIFARDPVTGDARWAYQTTPHDSWDYDGVNESIPVDITVNGQATEGGGALRSQRHSPTRSIGQTGEVLVAQPYQDVNWATGVDLKTGWPTQGRQSKETHQGVNTKDICPSSTGARDQQPAGYSPRTGSVLHADDEAVHGLRGDEGELHCWNAVPGRRRAHVC